MVAPVPPLMAPPMPVMPDPAQVKDQIDALIRAFAQQAEELRGPFYPAWYKPEHYPKPSVDTAFKRINRLHDDYAALRGRIAEEETLLHYGRAGVLKDFNPDEEDTWPDSAMVAELELMASSLAEATRTYDCPARRQADEDEAGRKVDFLYYLRDEDERGYELTGHGPLTLDEARTFLMSGRLCKLRMPNLDAGTDDCPQVTTMVDPATFSPAWDQHGMKMAGWVYRTLLQEAIDRFDGPDGALAAKYYSDRDDAGRFQKKANPDQQVEVAEYWDRRWRVCFIDGKAVLGPVEHKLGRLPFTYQLSGLGLPAYLRDPVTDRLRYDQMTYSPSYGYRDTSQPHKGIGIIGLLKMPHQMREAVLSRMLTAWQKSIDPPYVAELDELRYKEGVPPTSRAKGSVNPVMMGREALKPMNTDPSQASFAPIAQAAADNLARLTMPDASRGMNEHSNVSGYAQNAMNSVGTIKLVPFLHGLRSYYRNDAEWALTAYRDWGHLIDTGSGPGAVAIPRFDPAPNESPYCEVTTGDIIRTGTRVKVELSSMPVQMLGPLAAAITQLMNVGLMDEIDALKLLKTPNPYRTLQRIKANRVLNDPAIQEAQIIDYLKANGMEGAVAYIQARKLGAQMPGATPAGGGDASMGSPVTMPGESLPAYGMGPGPGSGPQGTLGPRTGPEGF